MINYLKSLLLMGVFAIAISGCSSHKRVAYLQDSAIFEAAHNQMGAFDARIMPKDLISVIVSTSNPEAAVPFNLTVPTILTTRLNSVTSQPSVQQYLVGNDGTIDFPILGKLRVAGLTKDEAEDFIKEKLEPYLKEEPIINVRMTNYKISVLGEVKNPGVFVVTNEKVTIFEALAMAGDLTIYGERNNVKLIRETADGVISIMEINLNESDLILSPNYYLLQNDVLYVTPNSNRSKDSAISTSRTIWLSITSTLISVATLLVSILT